MTPSPIIPRPDPAEYGPGFGTYIALVPDADLLEFLERQLAQVLALLNGLTEDQALIHHAPYTWSIKQVVGHMSDTERIFAYRALRIARNDPTPLAPFDQDAYMTFSDFDRIPLGGLLAEFEHVRRSNLLLFEHMTPQAWARRGVVNDHAASAGTFAFAIGGHAKHHLDILRRRLGSC